MSAGVAILVGACALGCLAWIVGAGLALGAYVRLPRLARLEAPPPARWPRLSIVVPARDEAAHLGAAMASLLAEDYPELEVVLVDDRSTDGTGELADALAGNEPRLRVLHVDALPEGWLGKTHALQRGVEAARGEWLLFTDADVHLVPGTLRRAVAWCEQQRVDQLTALPDVWAPGLLLGATVAAFGSLFLLMTKPWAVSDPESDAALGVGAFNLVRRSAFERTEGFAWLRLDVADDLALGLLMKRSGARCAVAVGQGAVGLAWYDSLSAMAVGLEKNTFALAGCSFMRLLLVASLLVAIQVAPLLALALPAGWPALPLLGGLALLAGLTSSVLMARRARQRLLPILLAPLGALVCAGMLVRSGWLGARRGGILWRDTFYPSALLRARQRVHLGGREPAAS